MGQIDFRPAATQGSAGPANVQIPALTTDFSKLSNAFIKAGQAATSVRATSMGRLAGFSDVAQLRLVTEQHRKEHLNEPNYPETLLTAVQEKINELQGERGDLSTAALNVYATAVASGAGEIFKEELSNFTVHHAKQTVAENESVFANYIQQAKGKPIFGDDDNDEIVLDPTAVQVQGILKHAQQVSDKLGVPVMKQKAEEALEAMVEDHLYNQADLDPAGMNARLFRQNTTITIPNINDNFEIDADSTRPVEFDATLQGKLFSRAQTRMIADRANKKALLDEIEVQRTEAQRVATDQINQAIVDGDPEARLDALSMTWSSGSLATGALMFEQSDHTAFKELAFLVEEARANAPSVSNQQHVTEALVAAHDGTLDMHDLSKYHLNPTDLKRVQTLILQTKTRLEDREYTVYNGALKAGKDVIANTFRVRTSLFGKADQELLQIENIVQKEYYTTMARRLKEAGDDPSKLDPVAFADELIAREQNAFGSRLTIAAGTRAKLLLPVLQEPLRMASDGTPVSNQLVTANIWDNPNYTPERKRELSRMWNTLVNEGYTVNVIAERNQSGAGLASQNPNLDGSKNPKGDDITVQSLLTRILETLSGGS